MEFALQPFGALAPALTITGVLSRSSENQAIVQFLLTGALSELSVAPPAAIPERRDLLWQTTCLEFFLGVAGARNYFEFNLSPAGHWNVYAFDDYRSGMRPVDAFTALPFTVTQTVESLTLTLTFDLEQLVPREQALDVSVTSVIEQQDGALSYWALAHSGVNPDFHRRDSFIGTL